MHFNCAGFQKTIVLVIGDLDEVLSKRSLHDLAQVHVRRSCGDPGGVLSKSSLHGDFADASLTGACVTALLEDVGGLRKSWSQDLASSASAAAGPFMTIL